MIARALHRPERAAAAREPAKWAHRRRDIPECRCFSPTAPSRTPARNRSCSDRGARNSEDGKLRTGSAFFPSAAVMQISVACQCHALATAGRPGNSESCHSSGRRHAVVNISLARYASSPAFHHDTLQAVSGLDAVYSCVMRPRPAVEDSWALSRLALPASEPTCLLPGPSGDRPYTHHSRLGCLHSPRRLHDRRKAYRISLASATYR
ncbi:hypothetical protein BV20DRAFT_196924 [Pilatotrama ljubarskyi]|nr:hypothetical protein BV20DRAFT_196924 [Pilatotrama ljubarskyi]